MLSKFVGLSWAVPLFTAALSALMIISSFGLKLPYEAGLTTFFCFLPSAFYFAAVAQIASQKQVRDLQKRIEQLEAQVAR